MFLSWKYFAIWLNDGVKAEGTHFKCKVNMSERRATENDPNVLKSKTYNSTKILF